MPTTMLMHTATQRTLVDRVRACREGLEPLLAVWRPTVTAWDKKPTWDNWNKTSGGQPWDNRPTWDNWNKK